MKLSSIVAHRSAGGLVATLTMACISSFANAEALQTGEWRFDGQVISTDLFPQIETVSTFKTDCTIDPGVATGEADLASFDGTPGSNPPSYAGKGQAKSIGIFAGGKNCGYIQSGDGLMMWLGQAFPKPSPTTGLGGAKAGKALYLLELKQDAISTIEIAGRTYTVTSGNAACDPAGGTTNDPTNVRDPLQNEVIANGCISDSSRDSADVWPVRLPLPTVRNTDGYGLCGGFDDPAEPGGELVPQPDCVWEAGTPLEPEVGTTAADINGDLPDDADNDGDADYLGPSFVCASNCHDDYVLEWGESDTEAATIETSEGKTGIKGWTIDVGLQPQGDLTCEGGTNPGGTATITTDITSFFLGDSIGYMQCRRQPNVNGSQCQPVPYIINGQCDGSGICQTSFLYGTQENGLDPENYASICEVYWPEREADFTAGNPIVPRTETSWGLSSEPGDVDLWYCPGVSVVYDENPICGDGVEYLLSNDGDNLDGGEVDGDLWANGGDVNPVSLLAGFDTNGDPANLSENCSLLQAVDNVWTPSAIADQCNSANCTVSGIQAACLIDQRTPVVQDSDATKDCSTAATADCSLSNDATTKVRTYQLMYQRGDFGLRSFGF